MIAVSLERARKALADGDGDTALDSLLEAWREKRVPRLADVIDRVGVGKPLAIAPVKALNEAWLALAEKKSARDVGVLLATPWPKKWQEGVPRMQALAEFEHDPRIAMALTRIVEDTPTDSWKSYAYYRPMLAIVGATGDLRTKPLLAADLAKEKSRLWNERNRGLVVDAHAKLEALSPPVLDSKEEAALAALEAVFASEVNETSNHDVLALALATISTLTEVVVSPVAQSQ